MNVECVERLIEHEAQPSALLCLETHSAFTISGSAQAYAGTLTGLVYIYGRILILSKEAVNGGKQSCRRSCAVFSLVDR